MEIMKHFGMQDCKPMATPMVTNWKKIDASKLEGVDPTLYKQLIGSLKYLVNTRPDKIQYDDPKTLEETIRRAKCLYDQQRG
jgi:hypothetical protein